MQHITLKHLLIDGQRMIGLQFQPNKLIFTILKSLDNCKWSDEFNMHYLPNNAENINLLFNEFRGIAWINSKHFFGNSRGKEESITSLNEFRNRPLQHNWRYCPESFYDKLERKMYSFSTARTYILQFEKFINYYPDEEIDSLSEQEIQAYLLQVQRHGYSASTINQVINSIKFYYEVVMGMPNRFYEIERPIKKTTLPKVLGKAEIERLIKATPNLKHRCIISLLYSSGLRRGELINLTISDINSDRMVVLIRDAKGGKDRLSILSEFALKDLRLYYTIYKPKNYLFEGPYNKKYTGSSISNIIHRAAKNARINKKVTPHMLRHSFATHLLESGVDLRTIQVLLGHNSSRTTEIYTFVATNHIVKVKSPFDSLNLDSI